MRIPARLDLLQAWWRVRSLWAAVVRGLPWFDMVESDKSARFNIEYDCFFCREFCDR